MSPKVLILSIKLKSTIHITPTIVFSLERLCRDLVEAAWLHGVGKLADSDPAWYNAMGQSRGSRLPRSKLRNNCETPDLQLKT